VALDPTVASLFRSSAESDPARTALVVDRRELSYRSLLASADRLAGRLTAVAGAARDSERPLEGQRVAVIGSNVPALAIAMLAAWETGAAVVPLNARLREYDLGRILADVEPAALVSPDSYMGYSFSEVVQRLLPRLPTVRGYLIVDELGEVEREEARRGAVQATALDPGTAAILYTSGTTGAPKGALVTDACLLAGARELAALLELEPRDVSVLVVPISHAFGLGCLLATVASGGSGVCVDSTFTLDPLLKAVSAREATTLHGSPALFAGVVKSWSGRPPTLRTGLVGGAACPPGLLKELDQAGLRILNVFGMTEIGAAAACRSSDPPAVRYATVGRPLPGYEFRVVHGAAPDLGELQVRGPHVTPGYYGQPERTADAFDDGWFRTGDVGSLDPDGHVRIAGRAKEVVHVAGFNVFPAEVESFLVTHPDVAQAAVVGVPHERMGEVLHAFVVPGPGAELTQAALLRFARSRIAGYKLPYAITIIPELPLLASGKPDRAALAEAHREETAA
jgi:acyl-CoA synthetase (AMP-forming)/AMP-acid ligase II